MGCSGKGGQGSTSAGRALGWRGRREAGHWPAPPAAYPSQMGGLRWGVKGVTRAPPPRAHTFSLGAWRSGGLLTPAGPARPLAPPRRGLGRGGRREDEARGLCVRARVRRPRGGSLTPLFWGGLCGGRRAPAPPAGRRSRVSSAGALGSVPGCWGRRAWHAARTVFPPPGSWGARWSPSRSGKTLELPVRER